MQSVVITGVSTGIGWSSAKVLIDKGFRVFGSVRKAADAERLVREFDANFVPLTFDVTDEASVLAAAQKVRVALGGERLLGLVNNAGIAVVGPALDLPSDDYRRQIETNVIGPVIVTRAFAPMLGTDKQLKGPAGRIVMISSVSGRHGNPLTAPYSMSKHALEAFSESLRRELMLFGIDVIVIGPGAVKTPIWDKGRDSDISVYSGSPYYKAMQTMRDYMLKLGKNGLPVERIGELVHHVLTTPRPKVRYAVSNEAVQLMIARMLPARMLDRIIAKRLGLLP
ncbi:SDR family oxidoreductase [Bradyrhizobium sp. LHD-71]|uniref:SDR family oxidoreductase n=1 Tax=Bradyrhizobium sp. LHD-71 TaxID=3072141 RepID=UPI00280E9273|nr:SDR family oxidoreductase [Bradyrhizobium sp. LHD-71]MDQ8727869.1 SDR family oxidoreductase [Bradyrhizobium sp. LHD-71]